MIMSLLNLLKDSLKAYFSDRSIIYAAGLAYYAVFAIAPLLVLVVSVAGLFVGRSAAVERIAEQVSYLVGPQLAGLLGELARAVEGQSLGAGATVLSVLGLLLGAAGIFTQLDEALNDIWGLSTLRPQSFGERVILLRQKTAPFVIVLFLGILLGSSVAADTLIGSLAEPAGPHLAAGGGAAPAHQPADYPRPRFLHLPRDLQVAAGCALALAGYGRGRTADDGAVLDRPLFADFLPEPGGDDLAGGHGGRDRDPADLGLLLGADRALWGGVYEAVRGSLWAAD